MFNSATSRLLIFSIGVFFILAFACNFLSISFRVTNANLERDIEQLEDEKSILRANYLSEIAFDKLNSKAGQMQMKHASSLESYKTSRKIEKQRLARILNKTKIPGFENKILLVSGY